MENFDPNRFAAEQAAREQAIHNQPVTQQAQPGADLSDPAVWVNNQQGYQVYIQQSNQAAQVRAAAQIDVNHAFKIASSTGGHGLTQQQTEQAYAARYPKNVYYPNQTSQGLRPQIITPAIITSESVSSYNKRYGFASRPYVGEAQIHTITTPEKVGFFDQHGNAFTPTIRTIAIQPTIQKFNSGAAIIKNKTQEPFNFIAAGQDFFTFVGLGSAVQLGRDTRRSMDITSIVSPTINGQKYFSGGGFGFSPIKENVSRQIQTMSWNGAGVGVTRKVSSIVSTPKSRTDEDYFGQAPWASGYKAPTLSFSQQIASGFPQQNKSNLTTYPFYEALEGAGKFYNDNVMVPFGKVVAPLTDTPQAQFVTKRLEELRPINRVLFAATPLNVITSFNNPFAPDTPEKLNIASQALVSTPQLAATLVGMAPVGGEILVREGTKMNFAPAAMAAGAGLAMQAEGIIEGMKNPTKFAYENVGMFLLFEGARGIVSPRVSPIGMERVQIPRIGEMKVRGGTETTLIQSTDFLGRTIEKPNVNTYNIFYLKWPFSSASEGGRVLFGRATTFDNIGGVGKPMELVTRVVDKEGVTVRQVSTEPIAQYKKAFIGRPTEIVAKTKGSITSGLQAQEGDLPWTRGQFAVLNDYLSTKATPQHLELWKGARNVGYKIADSSLWQPKQTEPFGMDVAQAKPGTVKAMLSEYSGYKGDVVNAGSRAQRSIFGEGMRTVSSSDFDTYMKSNIKNEAYSKGLNIIQKGEGQGFGSNSKPEKFHLNVRTEEVTNPKTGRVETKPEDFYNVHIMEEYPTFSKNPMLVKTVGGSEAYIMDPRVQVKAKIGGMLQGWSMEPGKTPKLNYNPGRVKDIVDTMTASRGIAADLYSTQVKYDVGGLITKRKLQYAGEAEAFSNTLNNFIETEVKRSSTPKPSTINRMTNKLVSGLESKFGGRLTPEQKLSIKAQVTDYALTKMPSSYNDAQQMIGTIKKNPLSNVVKITEPKYDVVQLFGIGGRVVEERNILEPAGYYKPTLRTEPGFKIRIPPLTTKGSKYDIAHPSDYSTSIPQYKISLPTPVGYTPSTNITNYTPSITPTGYTPGIIETPYTPTPTGYTPTPIGDIYIPKPIGDYTPTPTSDLYIPKITTTYKPVRGITQTNRTSIYEPNFGGYTPTPTGDLYIPKPGGGYTPEPTGDIYIPKIKTMTYKPVKGITTNQRTSLYTPEIGGYAYEGLVGNEMKINTLISESTSTGTSLTRTQTAAKSGVGKSRIYLPNLAITSKVTPLISEVKRGQKRRKRRGVLVSQFNVKVPVPRLAQLLTPMKFKYNKDPMPFNLKRSGTKVIVETFPGGTEWLRKGGKKL